MKRLAAAGVLTVAVGGMLLGSTPAMATTYGGGGGGDHQENQSLLGLQLCREVNAVIGVHNALGFDDESGDCANNTNID